MLFSLSLYLSLGVGLAGLIYKIWSWLTISVDKDDEQYSPGQRIKASLVEMARVVFSRRLGLLLKALVLDGLLQRRSMAHSRFAWLAHICIFTGFTGLVLFHAMGSLVTESLFAGYYSTLNPWLFLRDLLGVMVLLGVGVVVYRRLRLPGLRQVTRGTDRLAISFLALVLFSGFGLQALKISSATIFDKMCKEYAGISDPAQLQALRSTWAADYGVVFPQEQISQAPQVLALGSKINQDSCVDCHSPARHAFASYALSALMRPAALALDGMSGSDVLYHVHFLTLFLGLALLPFTKFFHLFTGPLLLGTNAAVDRQSMHPAARAVLRALEMDACSHCGTCSMHCSVAVAMRRIDNPNIVPSEKLVSLAAMVRGNNGDSAHLAQINQGAYLCTDCYRCTRLCPLGINLNDLWVALKRNLSRVGQEDPGQIAARQAKSAAEPSRQRKAVKVSMNGLQEGLHLSAQADSFAECYSCRQCTNACPLVFMWERPNQELDLLPHQVIHALKLGMREEAMGARMVWNCLTCYQCQEACPNLVQVTDIFYELRYMAAKAADIREA